MQNKLILILFCFVFLQISDQILGRGIPTHTYTHAHKHTKFALFFLITQLLSTVSLKSGRREDSRNNWLIHLPLCHPGLYPSNFLSLFLKLSVWAPHPSPLPLPTQNAAPPPPHVGSFLLFWPGAHRGPRLVPILIHPQWILCLTLPPLFLPLLNKIIRATAVTDQLQLIIQERTSLNQRALHYIK